jgi:putative DNA primase/helicase
MLKSPFICQECQKEGGYMNGHHDKCEQDYINNVRNRGIERTEHHCQCENIGHSWNAKVNYDKPVSDEDYEDYKSVNTTLPQPKLVHHRDSNRIDVVAKLLVEHYKYVTVRESGIIYFFNGKVYDSKNVISTIREETEQLIIECSKHDQDEVINKIKSMTYTDIESFDNDPDVITVENGIFNIRTQELTPHTPTNLSTILIPCRYDVASFDCVVDIIEDTKFWKYLESTCTFEGKLDDVMLKTVLEMMASCFIKQQIDEKAFMLLGNGDNGKSVVLAYIVALLGNENVTRIPLQDLSDKPFAAANLDHKCANVFTDIEATELKKAGKLKAICSGEGIYVEYKGVQGFDMYPFCKLIFSSNKFPKVYDQSDGFFRRWIIIEFRRKFAIGDPDRIEGLKESLPKDVDERNLVFGYLMGIAQKLLIRKKFQFELDYKAIRKIWNANADPINDFVENYIIDVEKGWKSKRDTYRFYKKIALDKGDNPLTYRQFNKAFAEYFDEGHSGTVRTWLNIDFKEPKQESLEEFDE